MYPLSAFPHDITTLEGANQAFGDALKAAEKEPCGGGIIEISIGSHPDFRVILSNPHITVIDARGGTVRLLGAVQDDRAMTDGFPESGLLVQRTRQNPYPSYTGGGSTQAIQQRNLHGSSSFGAALLEDVVGKGAETPVRWYPSSIEGIFVGQHFEVSGPKVLWPDGGADFVVTDLGWDADRKIPPGDKNGIPAPAPYFEAAAPSGVTIPKKTVILSKQALGALTVIGEDHCANQATALAVLKNVYGQGDSFGSTVQLWYQGDIFSGGGDEGGVGSDTAVFQDLSIFRGKAQDVQTKVDGVTGKSRYELTYQDGGRNVARLGSCRPIINMNAKKWVTSGKVRVYIQETYQGTHPASNLKFYAGVVQGVGTSWTPAVIGRYFALNVASEYLAKNEPQGFEFSAPEQPTIYRWFRIADLISDPKPDPNDPNPQLLLVHLSGVAPPHADAYADPYAGAPPLLDVSDYYNYNPKAELDYVIAPGALVADASRGIAENDNLQGKNDNPQGVIDRILVLQPNADLKRWPGENEKLPGKALFESGEPIEQALGGATWNPTCYRAVHANHFVNDSVSYLEDYSFLSRNLGTATVKYGLALTGAYSGMTVDQAAYRYPRGKVAYDTGMLFDAAMNLGLLFSGDIRIPTGTKNFLSVGSPDAGVAVDFEQTSGNRKVIAWSTKPGPNEIKAYATLGFDPETMTFFLRAGTIEQNSHISIGGASLQDVRGISGTGLNVKPGNNLGGLNVEIPINPNTNKRDHAKVTFKPYAEPPDDAGQRRAQYGIQVTTSWPTLVSIPEKKNDYFVVNFESPAPADGTFDWFLIRCENTALVTS